MSAMTNPTLRGLRYRSYEGDTVQIICEAKFRGSNTIYIAYFNETNKEYELTTRDDFLGNVQITKKRFELINEYQD